VRSFDDINQTKVKVWAPEPPSLCHNIQDSLHSLSYRVFPCRRLYNDTFSQVGSWIIPPLFLSCPFGQEAISLIPWVDRSSKSSRCHRGLPHILHHIFYRHISFQLGLPFRLMPPSIYWILSVITQLSLPMFLTKILPQNLTHGVSRQ